MTELPTGAVTIADLYNVLVKLQTDMVRVATKLEVIDNRNKTADTLHIDHETRLRALESFKWKVIGAVIALDSAAVVVQWMIYMRGHK